MSHSITSVNKDTDTFLTWLSRTNEMANVITNEVLTANTNANGASVTGNSYVFGILGSDTLTAATALRGGNVQSSNVLTISSNVAITDTLLTIGNSTVNVTINTISFVAANLTAAATFDYKGLSVGNSIVNATGMALGNSTVNVASNSTVFALSIATTNISANATTLKIGNTTLNVVANSSLLTIANSTSIANLTPAGLLVGTTNINTTAFSAGVNVYGNTTALFVGNSSINAVVTSSKVQLSGNAGINSTALFVGNSSVNVVINSSSVSIGNATLLTSDTRDSVSLDNVAVGTAARVNFVTGNNIFLNVTKDTTGNQVNVQINAVATSGTAIVGGGNNAVQFNENGNFNGDENKFSFDRTTSVVTVANTLVANIVQLTQSITVTGNSVAFTDSNGPDDIDTIALDTYRAVDYFYSMTDDGANGYQSGKLLVLQDDTNGNLEEFAVSYSNTLLGSFGTTSNTTHVKLQFTPADTLSYTVKFVAHYIPI